MSELDAVVNGPMLRTRTNKIVALLRHFKGAGRTLRECTHRERMGMSLSTLKKYCRDAGISFPDYTPLHMRKRERS